MIFLYRQAYPSDALKLSILFKQVYIATYGKEGVSDEFANFIDDQFSPERILKTLSESPSSLFVATHKSNLVGVAEIDWNKRCPMQRVLAPELNKLYILEWFCGKGIGHQLIRMAEKHVLANGFDQLWLWVLESNNRAIRFYEKQQYQAIGHASFEMEVNTYENVVMLKKLGDQ